MRQQDETGFQVIEACQSIRRLPGVG
jgi:hypothetical protein